MNGSDLATYDAPALTTVRAYSCALGAYNSPDVNGQNNGRGLECGEDAQRFWQPRPSLDRSAHSESDPEHSAHHPNPCAFRDACTTAPDYPYEGGDARMGAPPPAPETVSTPRCSPVQSVGGHTTDHLRPGNQPLQSPLLLPPPPPPRQDRPKGRAVHVQDVVIRLLITSQLDTPHVDR